MVPDYHAFFVDPTWGFMLTYIIIYYLYRLYTLQPHLRMASLLEMTPSCGSLPLDFGLSPLDDMFDELAALQISWDEWKSPTKIQIHPFFEVKTSILWEGYWIKAHFPSR